MARLLTALSLVLIASACGGVDNTPPPAPPMPPENTTATTTATAPAPSASAAPTK